MARKTIFIRNNRPKPIRGPKFVPRKPEKDLIQNYASKNIEIEM